MPNEISPRQMLVAVLILFLLLLVGGVLITTSRPEPIQIVINPPRPSAIPEATSTREPIAVYVTGAVARPEQLLRLPFGSRVEDAVNAVGGFNANADKSRVNLAAALRDGDQIHVPVQNEILEYDSPLLPTAQGGGTVYINTATLEELMTLPSIGETTAQAIIDYREANGAFTSLDDLDNVSGVGAVTLERIAPLISLDN